eukprot:TRINITY_DN2666_c1_g1_i1.p2 TRINITY_DN2666_c1_g1~~TRINITY_DN2666_c1_g1_i1.p2  ORF type:complete len:305 (-),score=112.97 TRINITY_DN2666_c1_g1_i1:254-1168(-)
MPKGRGFKAQGSLNPIAMARATARPRSTGTSIVEWMNRDRPSFEEVQKQWKLQFTKNNNSLAAFEEDTAHKEALRKEREAIFKRNKLLEKKAKKDRKEKEKQEKRDKKSKKEKKHKKSKKEKSSSDSSEDDAPPVIAEKQPPVAAAGPVRLSDFLKANADDEAASTRKRKSVESTGPGDGPDARADGADASASAELLSDQGAYGDRSDRSDDREPSDKLEKESRWDKRRKSRWDREPRIKDAKWDVGAPLPEPPPAPTPADAAASVVVEEPAPEPEVVPPPPPVKEKPVKEKPKPPAVKITLDW